MPPAEIDADVSVSMRAALLEMRDARGLRRFGKRWCGRVGTAGFAFRTIAALRVRGLCLIATSDSGRAIARATLNGEWIADTLAARMRAAGEQAIAREQ